ncbi:zinc-dependent metalloprotease [Acidiferrimicrobium sp. IK]|uniref:zinc-dependent metalloprotease n=1 Tax=Acidiferrimicrobium sp. IK TaxID=2871700 RepID=UPI0021CB80DC|nr:zinc-dependent metalloprotease [Acidiferrimicrobium sp. IK]MCU4185102.1 zinc-dependent metalloprotease [Acidiferrimicrobium sp. IK]
MSEIGPFGAGGPFEDLMRNLAQMLTSQGPVNWDIARQLASWTATGGETEANPDPLARVRLEELLRVAEMHIAEATGLEVSQHGMITARSVTRSEWALRSLEAWRPLLEALAGSMVDTAAPADTPPPPDPMSQLLGNLPQVLGPFLFGMQAGSMVGQLAQRALGQYDLPMPRPPADELLFVPATIDTFASEWSLSPDDVRMWVCLREVTNHAVLGRPHVRARLDEMIRGYVDAFEPDPRALEERLGQFDPTDMQAMQSMFGDPSALLGEMQTDEQRRLQVPLRALLSALSGYVDHVMDSVGRRLVGGYGPLTEALRRRRLEEHPGTRILGQLFGVELDAAGYDQGQSFVTGILERAGEDGLRRLWHSAAELPTPAELAAPGLWLARIDLPSD